MNFQSKLATWIGDTVQVVTAYEVTTGVLVGVTDATATIRTASAPGYGSGQDVIYQLDRIIYVRGE